MSGADFLVRWAGDGEVLLVSIAPWKKERTQAASFDGDGSVADWIERHNRTRNVYFSPNRCRPGLAKKATKHDVTHVRGIWADVDPDEDLELETGLAAERQRLHALANELMDLPWPPTVAINSGNGIQPLWRLEDEVEALPEIVAAAERLCARVERALGASGTHNLDRVLRLPGTVNYPNAEKRRKGRGEVEATILAETGLRYSWNDLEALAAHLEDEPPENAVPVEYRARGYINGHAVHLDGLPDYPTEEQIEALLENHAKVRLLWDRTTPSPPEDTSPSGWDQSFASTLAALGFPPERVASYLRAYRAHHSPEKGKQDRADYILRTAERAQPAHAHLGEALEPGGEQDDCPPEDGSPYEPGPSAGAGTCNGAGQQQTAGDAQGKNRATFKQGKPAGDWPEPGVFGDPPPAPKFPIELLPQQLRWWVATQAETMGIPCDVLALPALVCIAGAIGKDAVLKAKRHDLSWTERACIWGALIMPKGSLKSPAIKAALAPLRAAQAQARERWHEEVRDWEARQEWTSKGAIKPNPDPKPKEPKFVLGDATIEAIADAMVESRGLTLIRDELSGLVANMSRYNKGSDRPFYLECHAGGCYTVDRVIRGRQIIPEVYLNIFGGIQPKVAKKAFASAESGEDDGFFERFGLLCYPDPIPWTGIKDGPPQRDFKQLYSDACLRLSRQDWATLLHDELMRFDDQAQDRFLAWYDGHMRTRVRTPGAEERPDHGFLSKGGGLVLRLTITLHLFRWTCGETASPIMVDLASLEPAMGIFERYCVAMYDRICKAFDEGEAHEGAARLCDYIRKKKLTKLRVADITKLHWQGMVERAAVLKAFEALEDIDWLRRVAGPTRGRPSDSWAINPKVHQ